MYGRLHMIKGKTKSPTTQFLNKCVETVWYEGNIELFGNKILGTICQTTMK
jgi:hypothetical protein